MDSVANDPLAVYGLDKEEILALADNDEWMGEFISEKLQMINAQVVWAVRKEWARTVEDVLARRTRALFLDARESIRMAPEVAKIMADELGNDEEWISKQVKDFENTAKNYFFNS